MDVHGILGPFTFHPYDDVVKLHEINWGVYRSQTTPGGALGTREYDDLVVLKDVDMTSLPVLENMIDGTAITSVDFFYFREDTAIQQLVMYYHIELTGVRIKDVDQFTVYAGGDGFRHLEQIRMIFQQIEWNYYWNTSQTLQDSYTGPSK
jgi:type VI secretion system Hcp family effector